jgi:hypothetical protein
LGVAEGKRSLQFGEKDLQLIQELGLDSLTSFESVEEKVSLLNMRQLYKLKLMFLRFSSKEAWFSEAVQTGIHHNEPRAFSEAFFSLWKTHGPLESTSASKDKA